MPFGASPHKLKKVESPCVSGERDDGRDYDAEIEIILEEMDGCQNELGALTEKGSEEILNVEKKFNKLRKPYFEMGNAIMKRTPNLSVTAFRNHLHFSEILTEDEKNCLQYLSMLEVEEFEDIKSGYRINFHFYDNPYLENEILTKGFHFGSLGDSAYHGTLIRWKEGSELFKERKEAANERGRVNETKSFFQWFTDHTDPSADDIAEVIKEDIWPNPLQYYLVSDIEAKNGFEGEEETTDDDDDDDDDGDEEEEENDHSNDCWR
ncbi:protein SET-like [Anabrus simplex]|uniref:protein SET-like n=1 Tax=Anabrus simplex TaxID=316456 RepID=UPI0035A2DB81